ncbi:MAG: hypothetical protein ACTS2F_22315 [Thainema sp.]
MTDSNQPDIQPIQVHLLPEYEKKLLTALSFFLGRPASTQALACLSMYLRQSEPRVMSQVRYYAHKISKQSGQQLTEYELLDLIFSDPDRVSALLEGMTVVHTPEVSHDVFAPDS